MGRFPKLDKLRRYSVVVLTTNSSLLESVK